MATDKEQLQAADRICRHLNISIQEMSNLLDRYNKRVHELNEEIFNYATSFIQPKGVLNENQEFVYHLNDDDRAILAGYNKRATDQLKEEFPEIYEVWDDVKIFQTNDLFYGK